MTKRTYDQYCPVAEALDVVGERWTLLIVRELLTGPKRYTDLKEALPGIWTNLLAARLRELEELDVVRRLELPPPAARTVYELTDDGRRLAPVVSALARWGMRRLGPPGPEDEVSPSMAVRTALLAYASGRRMPEGSRTWGVVVDGVPFTISLEDGQLELTAGPLPPSLDAILRTSARSLVILRTALAAAETDAAAATADPAAQIEGDSAAAAELVHAFALERLAPSDVGVRRGAGVG